MTVEHIIDVDHLGHATTSHRDPQTLLHCKQAYPTQGGGLGGLRRVRRRASLRVAQASMRQAEQIRRALAERSEAVVQRVESALKHIVPLVQQVITQTE